MTQGLSVFVLLVGVAFSGCYEDSLPIVVVPDDVVDAIGTIHESTVATYIIITHSGERFLPQNMSEDFRQDGLEVIFSGRTVPVSSNERLLWIPIVLSNIDTRSKRFD